MAKVRNISGEARYVPELGFRLVEDGEVVEVPDARLDGYTCQASTWQDESDAPANTNQADASATNNGEAS